MAAPDLALFDAHPALRSRLPRRAYLTGPTPIQPLPLDGIPEGQLCVKRDDHSCALYGGNKPRKLEFLIGRALERGARRLVTTGGLGTHHGLATAVLGRAAGLETTLAMLHQPVTPEVRESLLLGVAYGARLVYGSHVPGVALCTLGALAAATARGERPVLVPTGGSSPLGNLGFVSAGFELAAQVRAGQLPEPAAVYVAVGTGGSLAGLVLGLRLAGLRSRVIGVLVTDILPPTPRGLARAARRSLRLLRRLEPRVPEVEVGPGDFDLFSDQLGAGYGAATPAAREAVAAAGRCGLALETTYTGKCLAAVRERARRGELPGGPLLYWHTFNGVDLRAGAPDALDAERLPRRIRRVLATAGAP